MSAAKNMIRKMAADVSSPVSLWLGAANAVQQLTNHERDDQPRIYFSLLSCGWSHLQQRQSLPVEGVTNGGFHLVENPRHW